MTISIASKTQRRDPNLQRVQVALPGPDGEDVRFKLPCNFVPSSLQKSRGLFLQTGASKAWIRNLMHFFGCKIETAMSLLQRPLVWKPTPGMAASS